MSRRAPRPTHWACSESQALIDESANLISGSGEAIALQLDQIARSKKMIEKSRKQISDARSDSNIRLPFRQAPLRMFESKDH